MRSKETGSVYSVFSLMFLYRLVNALLLHTHFEPDEYFQSIEVCLNSLLGKSVFTWEWFFGIRSVVFLGIFYGPLWVGKKVLGYAETLVSFKEEKGAVLDRSGVLFMLSVPYIVKTVCALIAALGDYSTLRMYRHLYGTESQYPREIMLVSLMNIGQWLYATRSHVNSFEMSFCAWVCSRVLEAMEYKEKAEKKKSFCVSAFLTGYILYIRPTALFILGPVWVHALYKELQKYDVAWKIQERKKEKKLPGYYTTYFRHTRVLHWTNFAGGLASLALWTLCDSLYYKELTVIPYEFYRVNMQMGISRIFGEAPPYTVVFFFSVLMGGYVGMLLFSKVQYTSIELIAPVVYLLGHSAIAHKEMRFLLPAVPFFNIIVAKNFKHVLGEKPSGVVSFLKRQVFSKKVFVVNLLIGVLIGLDHQNIARPLSFLRSECKQHLLTKNEPVFILSTFRPYMLPFNTYLGHRRVVVRAVENNPDLSSFLGKLQRKKAFSNVSKHPLVLQEHDMFSSCMIENILRAGPQDYNYLVVDSIYDAQIEEHLPQFIKVHTSTHARIPSTIEASIYKRVLK
ncbi:GPI mannosyltransferase 3 [Nematocida sp. AWRm77]|nr:GPI mannosyltransferase 3 [Nematocida sp. AWRm77]